MVVMRFFTILGEQVTRFVAALERSIDVFLHNLPGMVLCQNKISIDYHLKLELEREVTVKSKMYHLISKQGTLEWWISGLMLNPFFLLILRIT